MPNSTTRASYELNEADLNRIYAALASETTQFRITHAGTLFRAAGLVPSGDQRHWAPLMESLDTQFRGFSEDEKLRTVRVLAQRLMREDRPEIRDSVTVLLRDHGFQYVNNTFVPVDFFDQREARYLPPSALSEISTALGRLVDGDLDGALTSACGAVDTTATSVYQTKSLGDPAKEDSFRKKAMNAIAASGKLAELESELVSLGWDEKDAHMLRESYTSALNQAAHVMQMLRPRMGDVHGAKPAIESVVYDVLKLASVLTSLMK